MKLHIKTLSLKTKLLLICTLVSFIMSSLVIYVYTYTTQTVYYSKKISEVSRQLSISIINIERDYQQLLRFCDNLDNNSIITTYLATPNDEMNSRFLKNTGTPNPAGSILINAYQECLSSVINYSIYDDLVKCLITSASHNTPLIFGSAYGDAQDFANFEKILGSSEQAIEPIRIIESPFPTNTTASVPYIVPFRRNIVSSNSNVDLGDIYIALSTNWITRQLAFLDETENHSTYIKAGNHIYLYTENSFTDVTATHTPLLTLASGDHTSNFEIAGSTYVSASSVASDITILQKIPEYSISLFQQDFIFVLLLYIAILFFSAFLFYTFLNRIINKPIRSICSQLQTISAGQFTVPPLSYNTSEFQLISSQISDMSSHIALLLEETKEKERQKQNYRFKMLQNQINPHFLYNTLNSIRWVAEINNVSGIATMTTSFMSLLRQIFQNNSPLTTLQDELSFIENYSTLQSYRYGNVFKVTYDIPSKSLQMAQMIRFSLQPILENAIFHGIDHTCSSCTIHISALIQNEDLYVSIKDNGVGIDETNLTKLNQFSTNTSTTLSSIGLQNINERIKLEYGDAYGLHIDSKLGEYTCVTIHIPFILHNPKEDSSHV